MRKNPNNVCGIYKITNPIGQIYIGQSKRIGDRWNAHKLDCIKKNSKVAKSLNIFGFNNHIFEIVEKCDIDDLYEKEKFWIKHFDTFDTEHGLNQQSGGFKKFKVSFSDVHKKNLCISQIGNTNTKGKPKSKEHAAKVGLKKRKNVIDTVTGKIYNGVREASNDTIYNYSYLVSMLNGRAKNKTTLKYV